MSINSSHSAFIVVFDKVWKKALVNAHNINEDGSINWNYVESDVYIDMSAAGFDIVKHEKMLKQELDFVMEANKFHEQAHADAKRASFPRADDHVINKSIAEHF
jgi:hypothetical protein